MKFLYTRSWLTESGPEFFKKKFQQFSTMKRQKVLLKGKDILFDWIYKVNHQLIHRLIILKLIQEGFQSEIQQGQIMS